MNVDILTKVIESFWNEASKPGSEYVKICYSIWLDDGPTIMVDIPKSNKTLKSDYTGLTYPLSSKPSSSEIVDTKWIHTDFLQRNGTYIRKLHISFEEDYLGFPDDWRLPDNFLIDIFTYCTNLQYLHLYKCYMATCDYTVDDFSKKMSLEELYFTDCVLYPGMSEQLSMFLLETKRLRIGKIRNCSDRTSDEPDVDQTEQDHSNNETQNVEIELIKPYTNIDTIIFDDIRHSKTMYLRIHVLDDRIHYYYRLDRPTQKVEILSEQEHRGVDNGERIYIRCPNKPDLCMEYPPFSEL